MLMCFCGDGYEGRGSGEPGSRGRRVPEPQVLNSTSRRLRSRVIVVASIALAVWLYLLLGRGAFWRCSERDDGEPAQLPQWPRVAAVVPARNEAETIAKSIGSLLAQDYRGELDIILVDDDSD